MTINPYQYAHTNEQVINLWFGGEDARNSMGSLWSEHGILYSYDLEIGRICLRTTNEEDGKPEPHIYLRNVSRRTGGIFISRTTSRHLNLAASWIEEFWPIRGSEPGLYHSFVEHEAWTEAMEDIQEFDDASMDLAALRQVMSRLKGLRQGHTSTGTPSPSTP